MNSNRIKITFAAVLIRLQNVHSELDVLDQYVDNLDTDEIPFTEPMRRVTEECTVVVNSLSTIQRVFPDEDSMPDELIPSLMHAVNLLGEIGEAVAIRMVDIQKKIVAKYNLPINIDAALKSGNSLLDGMVNVKCDLENKTRIEAMAEVLKEITDALS